MWVCSYKNATVFKLNSLETALILKMKTSEGAVMEPGCSTDDFDHIQVVYFAPGCLLVIVKFLQQGEV